MSKGFKIALIVIAVLLVLILVVVGWLVGGYNKAVTMDEAVKGQWAQVENQLKRRYDLIPNLVETVKGFAKHEKGIFENIAQARTKYFQQKSVKGQIEASAGIERALSRLLMLKEQYPVLKSNQNFLKLQDSLEGTENRIAVSRKRYNDAVKELNTFIRTFFGRFYAAFAGIEKSEYYELPEGQGQTPKVKFD